VWLEQVLFFVFAHGFRLGGEIVFDFGSGIWKVMHFRFFGREFTVGVVLILGQCGAVQSTSEYSGKSEDS
jgi:hypothetical protein